MKNVINTLEELGYVRNEELKAELSSKTPRQLILDFILPRVVEVGGQDTRGWRLGPSFMRLMTLHAGDFLEGDRELGELLFELALQRIQRQPRLKSIDYIGILPAEYQKYSAAWDQPGLWGKEEWNFMRVWFVDGLELKNEAYRKHARNLILEILSEVLPLDGGRCFAEKTGVPDGELYRWAVSTAISHSTPQEVAEELLMRDQGCWRKHIFFIAQFSDKLDWEKIFSLIDLEKEWYFTGAKRFALKLVGQYDKATKKCIREKIREAAVKLEKMLAHLK